MHLVYRRTSGRPPPIGSVSHKVFPARTGFRTLRVLHIKPATVSPRRLWSAWDEDCGRPPAVAKNNLKSHQPGLGSMPDQSRVLGIAPVDNSNCGLAAPVCRFDSSDEARQSPLELRHRSYRRPKASYE